MTPATYLPPKRSTLPSMATSIAECMARFSFMASFVVPVEEVLISMPLLTFFPIGLTRRNV